MTDTDINPVNRDNFPAITSRPGRLLTWVLRTIIWLSTAVLFLGFYALPAAFALDPSYGRDTIANMLILGISYPVLLGITWWLIRHVRSQKHRSVTGIRVDNRGIHYKCYDGSTDSILYSELRKNNNKYQRDVYAVFVRRAPYKLKVVRKTGRTIVIFQTDVTRSYYTHNVFTLRAHFIRGIRLFRPDLKIADSVFSKFYISRNNFTFEKRSYVLTIIFVVLLLVAIFCCALWFANSRLH